MKKMKKKKVTEPNKKTDLSREETFQNFCNLFSSFGVFHSLRFDLKFRNKNISEAELALKSQPFRFLRV